MPAGSPGLSVIIPCRDGAGGLPAQLAALAAQQHDGCEEVIVVDDGSTDASREVARTFTDQIQGLRVLALPHVHGPGAARNLGASTASAPVLLFLDADDEIAPGYVGAMRRALAQHELVAARIDYETFRLAWLRDRHEPQAHDVQRWHGIPVAGSCTLGVRRELFERLGGFSTSLPAAEDVDFCLRAHRAGAVLHLVTDAVLRYRPRDSLADAFRQARGQGKGVAMLSRLHREPMLRSKVKAGIRRQRWFRSMRLLLVWNRNEQHRLTWYTGYLTGYAAGLVVRRRTRPLDHSR